MLNITNQPIQPTQPEEFLCLGRYTMPYIVRPGDTLNSIAAKYGTNLVGLVDLNPSLRVREFTEGMTICVPRVPERQQCINGAYYVIKEGDSFYNIAKRYGIPLNILLDANQRANPYDLKIGQEICVPNVASGCPFGTVVQIKNGTRLSDILISYNLSLNELLEANVDFNPNIIVPGTELCIPLNRYQACDEENYTEYIIMAGDSLASLAMSNGITASEMLIANPNLTPASFLIVGTKVCIPRR